MDPHVTERAAWILVDMTPFIPENPHTPVPLSNREGARQASWHSNLSCMFPMRAPQPSEGFVTPLPTRGTPTDLGSCHTWETALYSSHATQGMRGIPPGKTSLQCAMAVPPPGPHLLETIIKARACMNGAGKTAPCDHPDAQLNPERSWNRSGTTETS